MGPQNKVISIASVRQVRAILKRAGVRPSKKLGQYFLVNRKIADKLIAVSETVSERKNNVVIEPGAGIGCLTFHIATKIEKVYAVEIDEKMCEILKGLVKDLGFNNIDVVNGDILDIDPSKLGCKDLGYRVIGSLPYDLSKKIIKKFLELDVRPSEISVLVQKEVAMEYIAKPPSNTFLAEYSRVFAVSKYMGTVRKTAFYPIPPVDGGIVVFKIKEKPIVLRSQVRGYIRLVRVGFSAPRKTLPNTLPSLLKINKEKLLKLFKKLGISPTIRAQELTTEQWLRIWNKIRGNVKFSY